MGEISIKIKCLTFKYFDLVLVCIGHTVVFLLQVFFAQPVVAVSVIIYLGSDGYTPVDTDTKYMRVDLLTPENQTIPVVPGNVPISCRENPIQVPIKQDLSKPFFLTQGEHIGNKKYL